MMKPSHYKVLFSECILQAPRFYSRCAYSVLDDIVLVKLSGCTALGIELSTGIPVIVGRYS